MTLCLMIAAPSGIWQSSDHRLTRLPQKTLYHDNSIKHLIVRCTDGRMLISYSGLGMLRNRFTGADVHVSDWINGLLRGEHRTVNETLAQLQQFSNERLAEPATKYKIVHTFQIGIILAGRPWAGVVSNMQARADWRILPPSDAFQIDALPVDQKPLVFASGCSGAVSETDFALLEKVAHRRPRRPVEYLTLLSEINGRASQHRRLGRYISMPCIASYMATADKPIDSRRFGTDSSSARQNLAPYLLFGIDIREMEQALLIEAPLMRQMRASGLHSDDELARLQEESRQRHEAAARRAIQPVDLLSDQPSKALEGLDGINPNANALGASPDQLPLAPPQGHLLAGPA